MSGDAAGETHLLDQPAAEGAARGPIRRLAGLSTWVTGLTIAGYGITLLRERATAAAYGASADLDAFLVASTITAFASVTVSRSIYDGLVPAIAGARAKDPRTAAALARGVVLALGAILLAFTIVVAFVPEFLVGLIAPGLAPATRAEASQITRFLAASIMLGGLSEVMRALLHGYEEFVFSSLLPVPGAFVVLGAIVFGAPVYGINALAAGTIAAAAVQLVGGGLVLARAGVFAESGIDRAGLRALVAPAALSLVLTAVATLSLTIDRYLGSQLPEGRIAILNYASKMVDVAAVATAGGIATVIYPRLARVRAASGDLGMWRPVALSIGATLALAVPLAIWLVVAAEPTVRIILGAGKFDAAAQQLTADSLRVYALALPFIGASFVLGRTLYVLRRLRVLLVQGALFVGVKLSVGLLLLGPLQHLGIAASQVLATVTATVFMGVMLAAQWNRRPSTRP